MCGITGVLYFKGEPVSPTVVERMTQTLAHRGPDGEGIFVDGPVGLGHRRLAIIDLSAEAAQPMSTPDGRFTIVYNGETYNFKELRRELEAGGVTFRSRSDTEVVLQLYAQLGPAALDRLNGMFALALWDSREKELFLARDRYGVKPLYYAASGQTFLFGSEVKAILAHPAFRVDLDKEALLEYFTFQNCFTDHTLFAGVRLLPPGHWLRLCADDSATAQPRRYWDFNFSEPQTPADEEEYAEELDRLFRQAVQRQLVSDVEVGAYLSGGMDSGSITAIAATSLPYIKTFTCGFDLHSASGLELSFDERERAEFMSYLFKTEHYEMVLKAGDMERCLPALAWHLEEPRVGQSYPNFYVARLASKFVKVAMSGAGGDELFGGYPWRYYRAVVNDGFEDYIDKYYLFWQRLVRNRDLKRIFQPIWEEVSHVWTRDIFRDVFPDEARQLTRPEDYVNHSLYFEAKTFLHGLLVVEDKLSMAHGLETRVPFLDNDLVDFAMSVPVRLKLKNLTRIERVNENEPGHKSEKYFLQTRDGKLLLRKVMERYIPAEIVGGIKKGFTPPGGSWFKGDSIDYVRRTILDPKAAIYEVLDYQAVKGLVEEHLAGVNNRRLLIWSLLSFEWFSRRFLKGRGEC
ncbi:MAG: asparagine synthase (glutamine-hydrolyzing) [Deltaproteobacteria bacterium]|nr:asparagine synthase (glutamine-hydrolyzing) [Deltaproteobacteria bacterium]